MARWLLNVLPIDAREGVLGDLEELFQERGTERGTLNATVWYWRQALSFFFRFVVVHIREALGGATGFIPSWIDLRLGSRLLVKSPLLTITGCVAIATAIGINASFHEFIRDVLASEVQLAEGERVVVLRNIDLTTGRADPRTMEDLGRWRAGMVTVQDLSAIASMSLNLVGPDGRARTLDVAEISSSGLDIAGLVPLHGRPLLTPDDGPAAEPVVVLGHDVWRDFFNSEPNIVGVVVGIGETRHTVVGVAPEGFRFPGAREAWVNFRRDPGQYRPRTGPGLSVFGRLAPGRSLEDAKAEIEQIGLRATADFPNTHAQLRPTALRYGEANGLASNPQARWVIRIARTLFAMVLLAACANIATLVFARNASRESEIAIRTALGAGRRRIATQLFGEALVLAILSTVLGLVVADGALKYGSEILWEVQRSEAPAWFDPGISLPTVVYSLILATLGAGVMGVFPALRSTRRATTHATLQRTGSGAGSLSFGTLPTAVIVVQIAVSVAFIPLVLTQVVSDFQRGRTSVSFSTEPYITARLLVDSEVQNASQEADRAAGDTAVQYMAIAGIGDRYPITKSLFSEYAQMTENVRDRLESEPAVRSVAFTTRLPGLGGQSIPAAMLEVDGQPTERGWYVRTAAVDLELFDVIGDDVSAGRGFGRPDYTAGGHRVALVNQAFARDVLGGRSPVGRQVRDFQVNGDPGRPWTEIIGVIPDDVSGPSGRSARIYYPLTREPVYPTRMILRVEGDPETFGPRLRALVADAEPGLILDEVYPLEELRRWEVLSELFWVVVFLFVGLVTMLLSTTGVYALMSFIVSMRTREIGIRTALGSTRGGILSRVFARALVQIGIGVVLGIAVVGLVAMFGLMGGAGSDFILAGFGVSAVLVVVGMIGCAIPVFRALRIEPMDALSNEG